MPRIFLSYLDNKIIYSCKNCHCHICAHDRVVSRNFFGKHGPALLIEQTVNTTENGQYTQQLMTGLHVISDLKCVNCNETIGWKYVECFETSQKYKQGKYLLEKQFIQKLKQKI
eukprot:NODE_638_length_5124_cov_1.416119.p7 type:complete len:114 gc:universal NODE_638_length_5124_cov_1.416119:3442-3783(+)